MTGAGSIPHIRCPLQTSCAGSPCAEIVGRQDGECKCPAEIPDGAGHCSYQAVDATPALPDVEACSLAVIRPAAQVAKE